jgi:hypothetical protein
MQSIKRSLFLCISLCMEELVFCISLCMLVFTGGLVWGHPFVATGSGSMLAQAQEQQQPQQEPAKSITFTGTVARDGEQFVLRDSSGGVYKLDDTERAKPFEGKAVKGLGRLDTDAKLIHVDSIETVSA